MTDIDIDVTAYDGLTIIAPCCHEEIIFNVSMLDSAAIRCCACHAPVVSSSLADVVYDTLLRRVGESPPSLNVGDIDQIKKPWLRGCGTLEESGVLLFRSAVDASTAKAVCLEAEAALIAAHQLPSDEAQAVLSSVREPTHRHDVRLELTVSLRRLLRELTRSDAPAGMTVEAALGEHASLCECSCIISDPGAAAQAVHCDTAAVGETQRRLLTCFVALQPIDEEMGPTHVWPGTHTPAFHAAMREVGPHVFRNRESVALAALGCGDCALMDSRLWHCGGANMSRTRRRCLLVVSFGVAGAFPEGSTYSLLPHLEGRHTLKSLREQRAVAAVQSV